MIILTIVGVVALLSVLIYIAESQGKKIDRREEENQLVFTIPNEIIANNRPKLMSLLERERRRRRLLGEVFTLGLQARNELTKKQEEDRILGETPYVIK